MRMSMHNDRLMLALRRKLRGNATPQEAVLWSRLKGSALGFKFRRQHSIGRYIVDFYCPAKKLAIEIDGSQHFEEERVEYDTIRMAFLTGSGVRVLRFDHAGINTNLDGVLQAIQSELAA